MKKLVLSMLLAGSSLFAGPRWFVGVGIGVPVVAPPPVVAYAPPPVAYAAPTPGYAWVSGYWYPVGPRYVWRPGYWARRPYAGAVWVGPRYHRGYYYRGYWRR